MARIGERDEMIMRPAWRSRTTARRRTLATSITTVLIATVGLGLMALVVAALDATGAPTAARSAPWYVPTAAALVWAMRHPLPAVVSEDGADSWLLFSIRATMVGVSVTRSRAARAVAAVVLGAPIAWGLLVVGALALAGVA